MFYSDNNVLRTLSYMNHVQFVALASKYGFNSYRVFVKYPIRQTFSKTGIFQY